MPPVAKTPVAKTPVAKTPPVAKRVVNAMWEVKIGGAWMKFDLSSQFDLERTFVTSATTVQVVLNMMGMSNTCSADAEKMTVNANGTDFPIRRISGKKLPGTVEYWDDVAWMGFDEDSKNQVLAAIEAKRKYTVVYLPSLGFHGDNAKIIHLHDPQNFIQVDRATQRPRPLRIIAPQKVVLPASLDWSGIDPSIIDQEYVCPVTQAPFKIPVVASDGHTYEYMAISKWMLTKQVSPVTAEAIATTLSVNWALRSVMDALILNLSPQTAVTIKRMAGKQPMLPRKSPKLPSTGRGRSASASRPPAPETEEEEAPDENADGADDADEDADEDVDDELDEELDEEDEEDEEDDDEEDE